MDIAEMINSGIVNLFDYSGFFRKNDYISNFERVQLSISYTTVSDNYQQEYIRQLKNDFELSIYSKVFKNMRSTYEYSVLDLRGNNLEYGNQVIINRILDEIRINNYKNLVVSSKIGSILQESSSFLMTSETISQGLYKIGSIYGYQDVYVDPYLIYDDMSILLFNDVFINIKDVKSILEIDETFSSRVLIDFNYSTNFDKTKIIHILDDKYPNISADLLQRIREDKINEILDGVK